MSLKFIFAISLICCIFLAPIYCQSQEFDDRKFREAKERDKYKIPVPLPTLRPQDQQQLRVKIPARAGWQTTPRPQNQLLQSPQNQYNRPQNIPQSEPIYYHPRYEQQEIEQRSIASCMRSQYLVSCQQHITSKGYQMNSLAGNIPDRRRPPQF